MTDTRLVLTRRELVDAVNNANARKSTRDACLEVAWKTDHVVIGQWNGCLMDQAGLVKKFERGAGGYRESEDEAFAFDGMQMDLTVALTLNGKFGFTGGPDVIANVLIEG